MNDFVQQFDALFCGRRDIYGDGSPRNEQKYQYHFTQRPLTPALLLQHLQGKATIGVYPIMKDSTVGWFALDFDAPKNPDGSYPENPFPLAWAQAYRQAKSFRAAGLAVYLERSRSGNGAHVWGFFDRPVAAATVRRALKPHLLQAATFDKMYPVQDELTDNLPYGNLICLPFNGRGIAQGFGQFYTDETEIIPPRDFLANVRRNPVEVIEHLAETAPPPTRKYRAYSGDLNYGPVVPGALKLISPYGCRFMRHCWEDRARLPEPAWYVAMQVAAHFEHGRSLAHALSRDYAKYNPNEVDAKFDQVLKHARVGCNYIHEHYPEHACTHCPRTNGVRLAPHYLAKRPILQMVRSQRHAMEPTGSFLPDLARIRALNSGTTQSGIPWGLPGMDEVIRLRPGEMTVVGAMQSIGKTWLMVEGMYTLAKRGIPVFVFSAETGRTSLRERLLARAAEVNSRQLRGESSFKLNPSEFAKLDLAAARLETMPIYTDFTSLDADSVLMQVEASLLEHDIPLDSPYVIFFDYLQFGSKMPGEDSEYDRLSRLSSEFKFVAKILEHPIVVFSQVKRESEGSDEPLLTWFRGSGRIEADLDVGLIITGERVDGDRAPRTIHVVKQREGPANLQIPYVLQQTYGRWIHLPTQNLGQGPLFPTRDIAAPTDD